MATPPPAPIAPPSAATILGMFVPRDGSGLHPMFAASPRQVALAEYLAQAAREKAQRDRRRA